MKLIKPIQPVQATIDAGAIALAENQSVPPPKTRQFKGVWIPAEIWKSKDLSINEKVMLIEIDSLQDPSRGCFKSNAGFADFFGLSKSRVSEIVSSLQKKGFICVQQIKKGNQNTERRIFLTDKIQTLFNPPAPSSTAVEPVRIPEAPPSESRITPSESRITPSENAALRGNNRVIQREGFKHAHAVDADAENSKAKAIAKKESVSCQVAQAQVAIPMEQQACADDHLVALTESWQPDSAVLVGALERLGIPELVCTALSQDAELIGTFVNDRLAKKIEPSTQEGWSRKLANWLLRDWQQLERPQTLEDFRQKRGFAATQAGLDQSTDCPLNQLYDLWEGALNGVKPAPHPADWMATAAAEHLACRWEEGFITPLLSNPEKMRYVDFDSALNWWQGLFAAIAADPVLLSDSNLSLETVGQLETFERVIQHFASGSPAPSSDQADPHPTPTELPAPAIESGEKS